MDSARRNPYNWDGLPRQSFWLGAIRNLSQFCPLRLPLSDALVLSIGF